MKRKILRGFDYQFYAPHSRYTSVKKEDIEKIDKLDIPIPEHNEENQNVVKDMNDYIVGHRV